MTVKCFFNCGNDVDTKSRYTWHRVIGWERPGKAGGSDVACRERHGDEFACDVCIRRLQAGVAPAQEALV